MQTREHCFKACPAWKEQQKTLWTEVRKETEGEEPLEDPGFTTDERCGRAVLDFLSTTDVGRRVPAPAEDVQSEASEWELREREEREEERRVEAEELGAEIEDPLYFPMPTFRAAIEEE